jgi:AcrR family transcriptional regulator
VAALTLIDDHGFDHLSAEAVARRAGAGKAGIYRRWSTREELAAAAIRMHSPITEVADTGSLRGDLLLLMRPWTRPVDRDERVCGQLLGPARHSDVLRDALQQAVVDPLTQATRKVAARHAARGYATVLTGQRLLARIVIAMWWERSLVQPSPWLVTDLPVVVDRALLPLLDTPCPPTQIPGS